MCRVNIEVDLAILCRRVPSGSVRVPSAVITSLSSCLVVGSSIPIVTYSGVIKSREEYKTTVDATIGVSCRRRSLLLNTTGFSSLRHQCLGANLCQVRRSEESFGSSAGDTGGPAYSVKTGWIV